jgi:hypothetical protein
MGIAQTRFIEDVEYSVCRIEPILIDGIEHLFTAYCSPHHELRIQVEWGEFLVTVCELLTVEEVEQRYGAISEVGGFLFRSRVAAKSGLLGQ